MGIKNFFDIFGEGVSIREKDLTGKRIGIDVSYEIYRASLGMKNINTLTDNKGTPTVLLNTLLSNIVKWKKLDIKGLIYVFDNPKPNPNKYIELEKRKATKLKAEKKLEKECNEEKKCKLEKRTFKITGEMINDVKRLLYLLGVASIEAPEGFEAEHLGAELVSNNTIDYFITTDSDFLVFGGESMLRKINAKKYGLYHLSNILEKNNITREELVHLSVILGSDFAEKSKGIGKATIFKKGPGVNLTDQQKKAKEYFLGKCYYDDSMITKSTRDLNKAIDWLVEEKNFNKSRIEKLLSVFTQ